MAGSVSHPMISITVPVYNERDNLRPLIDHIAEALRPTGMDYELILVNDGSSDGSGELLDELAGKDPRVRVIHFRRNYGQTAAISAAITHSRGELIVPMDGDLQNDANDIPRLIAKLEDGFDVVSGWRRKRHDDKGRVWVSQAANALISWISGVPLHDYGCTLKVYRRWLLDDVRLYGEMHRFIPIYAAREGGRVTELEVTHHPRHSGRSKYNMWRVPKVLLDLILLQFLGKAFDKPIHYFGFAGLSAVGLAVLVGLLTVYLRIFEGISFIETPLPLLVVLLLVMGVMFVFIGVVAELQMRTYYESQGKTSYAIRKTVNLPREGEADYVPRAAGGPAE